MAKKKRALALAGGGPLVGIQIGALKALEEAGIEFDVFTCGCVGSWVGCLYNSMPPQQDRIGAITEFFRQIFVEDDVFSKYPVPVKTFLVDYQGDMQKTLELMMDPESYQDLFLPWRIGQYMWEMWNQPATSKEYFNYYLSKGISLNPWARYMMNMSYGLHKSGRTGLVHNDDLVNQFIDFDALCQSEKLVYFNAYNLSKQQIELFVNRHNHPKFATGNAQYLMAGSSVLNYTANPEINGDKYCEGAVIDTVNFEHLMENHPDLDEVWVIKITDYKSIKPPQNLLDAELLAVMLPFTTIADDDIKLFKYHLKEQGDTTKVVEIGMRYDELNYHWSYANLDKGIEVGYQGAKATIADYS